MKIGDKVIWRNGKSKSRKVLPLGIADCEVAGFGTGPSGEECVAIWLPKFWADQMNNGGDPVWVIAADVEC